MQLFPVYAVDVSNLWADHSREESDGQARLLYGPKTDSDRV